MSYYLGQVEKWSFLKQYSKILNVNIYTVLIDHPTVIMPLGGPTVIMPLGGFNNVKGRTNIRNDTRKITI